MPENLQTFDPASFEVATLDPEAAAYYRPLGHRRYQPTLHTQGAWQPYEQHMAPVSGLLTHSLEEFAAALHPGGDTLQLCRLNFDILGLIPAVVSEVRVELLRPGRTIELLGATLVAGGKPVVRVTAWRLARSDTSAVSGGAPDPLPAPETLPGWDGRDDWAGGYITSVEGRVAPGASPGRTRTWLRTDKTLIEGVPTSDLARFVGLVDTANGIGVRVPPSDWMFPNTDLSVHLYRSPVAGWVGFDTTVTFGSDGVGLTSSALFDQLGPVGRAEQILTVRRIG